MSTSIDMQTQLFMQSKWIQTRNRFACTKCKQTIFFFFSFIFLRFTPFFSDALSLSLSLSQPSSITITYRFNAIYLYLMVIASFPMRTQLILINWLKGKLWAFVFDFSFTCMSIRFGFSCQISDFFFLFIFMIFIWFLFILFYFCFHECFSKYFHSTSES